MIVLDKVTKRFGPKILFENVSMQFDPGKRYGLTGANGAGKSTLLKMLEFNEDTDQGSITIPGNLRLGVLRQNHFDYEQERILEKLIKDTPADDPDKPDYMFRLAEHYAQQLQFWRIKAVEEQLGK